MYIVNFNVAKNPRRPSDPVVLQFIVSGSEW